MKHKFIVGDVVVFTNRTRAKIQHIEGVIVRIASPATYIVETRPRGHNNRRDTYSLNRRDLTLLERASTASTPTPLHNPCRSTLETARQNASSEKKGRIFRAIDEELFLAEARTSPEAFGELISKPKAKDADDVIFPSEAELAEQQAGWDWLRGEKPKPKRRKQKDEHDANEDRQDLRFEPLPAPEGSSPDFFKKAAYARGDADLAVAKKVVDKLVECTGEFSFGPDSVNKIYEDARAFADEWLEITLTPEQVALVRQMDPRQPFCGETVRLANGRIVPGRNARVETKDEIRTPGRKFLYHTETVSFMLDEVSRNSVTAEEPTSFRRRIERAAALVRHTRTIVIQPNPFHQLSIPSPRIVDEDVHNKLRFTQGVNANLRENLKRAKEDKAALNDQIADLNERLATLRADVLKHSCAATTELAQCQGELAASQTTITEMTNAHSKAEAELAALLETNRQLRRQLDDTTFGTGYVDIAPTTHEAKEAQVEAFNVKPDDEETKMVSMHLRGETRRLAWTLKKRGGYGSRADVVAEALRQLDRATNPSLRESHLASDREIELLQRCDQYVAMFTELVNAAQAYHEIMNRPATLAEQLKSSRHLIEVLRQSALGHCEEVTTHSLADWRTLVGNLYRALSAHVFSEYGPGSRAIRAKAAKLHDMLLEAPSAAN